MKVMEDSRRLIKNCFMSIVTIQNYVPVYVKLLQGLGLSIINVSNLQVCLAVHLKVVWEGWFFIMQDCPEHFRLSSLLPLAHCCNNQKKSSTVVHVTFRGSSALLRTTV